MFKSIFKQQTLKMLLHAALVGSVISISAQSASAQIQTTRRSALSPAGQQMLSLILRGLPPQARLLALNALRKIGPQRAEEQLAKARAMGPETLKAVGDLVVTALQGLPPQQHQAFIDGLFQVTPAEEQFTGQILNQVGQTKLDTIITSTNTATWDRIAKAQTDQGTINSLGPTIYVPVWH